MAAPSTIAKGTKGNTAGGTAQFTYMGSVSANDVLFLLIYDSGLASSYTVDASWTLWGSASYPTGAETANAKLYYKKATGSESGTENVQRFGYTLGVLIAQVYQFRGNADCTIEDIEVNSGTAATITWNAVTVGGSERTLIAFVANEADPGVPTGYTGSFTDNYTGIYLECNTKENVSSDGAVTDGGGSVAWASFHLSIRNGSTRSFIVN